jgi:hypothetical protein
MLSGGRKKRFNVLYLAGFLFLIILTIHCCGQPGAYDFVRWTMKKYIAQQFVGLL